MRCGFSIRLNQSIARSYLQFNLYLIYPEFKESLICLLIPILMQPF